MAEVCPKCGSENTRIENVAGFITGTRGNSICNDCNFSSMIFPHMNKSYLKSFKKTIKSNPVIPKKLTNKQNKIGYKDAIGISASLLILVTGVLWFVAVFGIYFCLRTYLEKRKS